MSMSIGIKKCPKKAISGLVNSRTGLKHKQPSCCIIHTKGLWG